MADIGTGATLVIGTAWTVNVTSLGFGGVTRPAIKSSHLGSANNVDTFIVGDLYDAGTIEVGFQVDTEDPNSKVIPFAKAVATLTINYPLNAAVDQTAAKDVVSGFITNVSWDVPLEDLCTGTATFKLTGTIVATDSVVI